MKDFYNILGVSRTCTSADIKDAYRKLSKKFHPDLNPGDAYFEDRFIEVKDAYEILIDPATRRLYNRQMHNSQPDTSIAGQGYQHPPGPYETRKRKFKSRGTGIGLIIVLMLMGLVLGGYIFRSFNHSKADKKVYVANNPPATLKKHKKKHNLKTKIAADSAKRNFDIGSTHSASKPSPKPITVKPRSDSGKINKPHIDFLYATYTHPNITGIVEMRSGDEYSSPIIASISGRNKILVLERGDTYYRVLYDHKTGYVPKWALEEK
jgi:curved DNA-binding protein CbpA